MSVHNEEIARLTGSIIFKADYGPLQRMLAMLKNAETSIARLGKSAEQMQAKLNKAFNVSSKSAIAEKAKLDSAVMKSQSKELATQQKLARLQHAQNTAAISERKLVATGQREEMYLQSASLKQQVAQAVLAAKQQKVQQELLKTKLNETRVQAASEQSQIRQARYAKVLQERHAQTVRLQQQAAMHQTKYQRAELALSNARASGIRQAERYKASKVSAAAREARAAERHQIQGQRFSMQQDRFNAWKTRQAEPESTGFGGLTMGLGAAAAGLYGLVSAVSYLNERVTRRQETAADTQQFDMALLASGNNVKERARIKEAYIGNSQEFGMAIDRTSAVAYSNMIQGFRAQGKTLEEAIQLQKDQAAVFRIGNLDKTQQYSAALQLNQGYSKDRFMGQDLRPLTDALGTRLTTILYKAIGKALGYKGDQKKLAGFILEQQHDGKINGAMVQQGMRDIVAQSQELLERHKVSLDAQQVRVENDQYLRSEGINKDPELIDALGQRLDAERQLIASATTLQEGLKNLDMGLIKVNTGMLRLLAGKNADDTVMTPQEKAQQVAAAGFPEGVAIDPSVMGGGPKPSTGEKVRDPIDRLYRWLTNTPDYEDGPANKPMLDWTLTSTSGLKFPPLDLSKFGIDPENIADGRYRQFRMPREYTSEDIMYAAEERQRQKQPAPSWLGAMDINGRVINKPAESNIDQSMHTDIKIDVVVNAIDPNGKALGDAIGNAVTEKVDAKVSQLLQSTRANQKEVE